MAVISILNEFYCENYLIYPNKCVSVIRKFIISVFNEAKQYFGIGSPDDHLQDNVSCVRVGTLTTIVSTTSTASTLKVNFFDPPIFPHMCTISPRCVITFCVVKCVPIIGALLLPYVGADGLLTVLLTNIPEDLFLYYKLNDSLTMIDNIEKTTEFLIKCGVKHGRLIPGINTPFTNEYDDDVVVPNTYNVKPGSNFIAYLEDGTLIEEGSRLGFLPNKSPYVPLE